MTEFEFLRAQLMVGGGLFAIGLMGFLVRRNMIVMFLCAEMMLQGISLSLAAWGRYHNDWGGQAFVVFIIAVAACEAAIALALILTLARQTGKLDMAAWQDIREADQPGFVDHRLPEEAVPDKHWPSLTPAGREPKSEWESEQYRSRI